MGLPRLPSQPVSELQFHNMANVAQFGGPTHLQEPISGPTGYPSQHRTPLTILVSLNYR